MELAKRAQSGASDQGVTDQVGDILEALNRFLGWTGDVEWRSKLESECSTNDSTRMPYFNEARNLGRQVNEICISLFTSSYLNDFSKRYLLF